jgi:hypothetical protein
MIDFYYWPTPNGHKVSLALEEMELDYTVKPINILTGEQHTPEFTGFRPLSIMMVRTEARMRFLNRERSCFIWRKNTTSSGPPIRSSSRW